MSVYVPSKLIIFVSTVVSTVISLLAGYMLYVESISVLRSAVEDSSAAASKSAKLRLAGILEDVEAATEEMYLLFLRDDVMNVSLGFSHITKIYGAHAYAAAKSVKNGYGGGYSLTKAYYPNCTTCTHPWEEADGVMKQYVWADPVLDEQGNPARWFGNGNTTGRLTTTTNGTKVSWLKTLTAVDEQGRFQSDRFHVEWEEPPQDAWVKQMHSLPAESWSPIYFWNAADGSPYAYGEHVMRRTLHWPQGTYTLVVFSFFVFSTWTVVIRDFKTAHTELVALDSSAGNLFAHTLFNGPAIKFECYNRCFTCTAFQGGDCLLDVNDLGPTVSGAINATLQRPQGTFFTADLSSTTLRTHVRYGEYFEVSDVNKTRPLYKKDYFIDTALEGGEYFLRRTHMFNATSNTFELLWLRSVSSVNEKVFAALVQLIIASVVIFVVDIVIAVLEIVLIARPLGRLVVGNKHLETMDLDAAEAHMNAMYKPVMVKEVACVTDGLLLAIRGLREYKAYLPNTLFVDGDTEVEEESMASSKSPNSRSKYSNSTGTASKAVVNAGQNLSMQQQNYRGTVVRLCFTDQGGTGFPNCFGKLVEVMQETARATKGLAHGFSVSDPFTFMLTWNVGLRCSEPKTRAVAFCNAISCSEETRRVARPVMAVAHGEFVAGNLGSATNKGFGMKGPALLELSGVSAVASEVGEVLARGITLVSPSVAEGAAGKFSLSAVTLLVVKSGTKPILVQEAGEEVVVKEGEWMYQLEEANVSDPVAVALREVQVDPKAKPSLIIESPTDIQSWALSKINEGRCVMEFIHGAVIHGAVHREESLTLQDL